MNLNYVEDSSDLEIDLWREERELQKNQENYLEDNEVGNGKQS